MPPSPNCTSPYISVVIPVYGSELILESLTQQLHDVMTENNWTYEIVYVCDRSPDKSWGVIQKLKTKFDAVRALLLRKNAGQHNALIAGLNYARGQVTITMDDDLQHSPADIPLLVETLEAGSDLVYAKFRSRKHPAWKIAGSKVNDLAARMLIKKPADLYLSPFRAFRATIREQVTKYTGPFVYIDGLLLASTAEIASVEVDHHERLAGSSFYGFKKSISLWLKMATSFSVAPLRLTSLVGLVVALIGFLFAIILMIERITSDQLPTGWASLIVTVLIIGGIQLLALGVIGEYVGRVLLTLNGRPQYIVGESLGFDSPTNDSTTQCE
ncbi:glycosyltransferase family 2 protein [Bordetella sp. LUAb4]|uniref:glycosyltransferase family 2 protein n=1 Tax=Bordetella sp. LUAb4 TaxID=2843195 RepID=UPI001E41D72B|nr:glycosyltransferase family 2 protein [Bordetella sp. LUAb4]